MNAPTSNSRAPAPFAEWQAGSFCATCPSWNRNTQDDSPIPKGECRFEPPKLFMLTVQQVVPGQVRLDGRDAGPHVETQIVGQTAFPVTMADCWCDSHPEREIAVPLEGERH